MIHMLSRFDLKAGIDAIAFAASYGQLAADMRELGLLVSASKIGQRTADTPMDTDADDAPGFYGTMTFRDRAQLDAAYAYLLHPADADARTAAHDFVKRASKAPIFTCWEDIPEN